MKAIIPVAGTGKRLRPLTYTQPKPLIAVAGKPIISFIIEQLESIGVEEYIFILGYLGEKIKDFLEQNYAHLNITYVQQEERLGTGHAIWTAQSHLKDADEVIVVFGDTITEIDFQSIMKTEHSTIAIKRVEDPREFGVVEMDEHGKITKVVEKPRIPKSNQAMVGIYRFTEVKSLLTSLHLLVKNHLPVEGFVTLTDAIQHMIDSGVVFESIQVDNWFDCGRTDVLLETNAIFLEKEGYASENTESFDNTIFIHPVRIGPHCKISNAIIGPHVTIGDHAVIDAAIIKNSIIGNFASIKEAVLQRSVVGNDTSIIGQRYSLNIGDNTEINFSSNE